MIVRYPFSEQGTLSHRKVRVRVRLNVRGVVQGVGFRPFVSRAAAKLKLDGLVRNTSRGVHLELEGTCLALERFFSLLETETPLNATITEVTACSMRTTGESGFRIVESKGSASTGVQVLPDVAPCDRCQEELFDPENRRYQYPFTNCTDCGPRFSILTGLPYDRERTTHGRFVQCSPCVDEYRDPNDRRFHAQPNACEDCGPTLSWRSFETSPALTLSEGSAAGLDRAADLIRRGGIVGLKGVGGYQLLASADDESAVRRLRERKRRPDKAFAVMVRDVDAAGELAQLDGLDRALLSSPAAPILLAPRRIDAGVREGRIAPSVAPASERVGVFLPSSALHHLLLERLGRPVVATSGNISGEPILTENSEAHSRLEGVADGILDHDRPIARPLDDTVVQKTAGGHQLLRCGRGSAPTSIHVGRSVLPGVALGAFLNNAFAMTQEDSIVLGQHLGDLDQLRSRVALTSELRGYLDLYGVRPDFIAADAHPEFPNVDLLPEEIGRDLPIVRVQHHHAHIASCALDAGAWDGDPVLGLAWDGTGYGVDGTAWGGEFLECRGSEFRLVGRLRPFALFGGDVAVREIWRTAVGLCFSAVGRRCFEDPVVSRLIDTSTVELLSKSLERGLGCAETRGVGRLFDAVAALCGVRRTTSYEGQAAMEFEDLADPSCDEAYSFDVVRRNGLVEIDWRPALRELLRDVGDGVSVGAVSARFHHGLASASVKVAVALGTPRVALTGGAFQNRLLSRAVSKGLREAGLCVLMHARVPPGDGGIAAGQLLIASETLRGGS